MMRFQTRTVDHGLHRTQDLLQHRSTARAAAFDRGRAGRARRPDAGARVLGPHRRPPRRGRFLPPRPPPDLSARSASCRTRACPTTRSRSANGSRRKTCRTGRRRELRDRARQLHAERGQHHRLRRDRAREVGAAAADRRRHRDRRRRVPARGSLQPGAARSRRAEGVPHRRSRRARTQGLRVDARGGQGSVPDPAPALREPGLGHRPADRLHRPRRDDRRPAALRPDHRRGAPVDGQDRARGQHGRIRGAQDQEGGRDLLDGNVGLAARVPPDFLARPHQPAAPAHRRSRGRGMAARDQRDHAAVARRRSSSTTRRRCRPANCAHVRAASSASTTSA